MQKTCVILNGKIINIGPWDYQMQQVQIGEQEAEKNVADDYVLKDGEEWVSEEEGAKVVKWLEPVYEDQPTNPFPDGATVEQRDVEYDPDRGWYEVGTIATPTSDERLATMEAALLEIILGGL